jgi:hypothetical protein
MLDTLERKGIVERHDDKPQIFSQAFARALHEGHLPLEVGQDAILPFVGQDAILPLLGQDAILCSVS